MRGYKGFNSDLTCRGFQYEIGQSYSHDGPIGLCKQGFHFCENLRDCFEYYYPDDGCRFCEVEAWEDIMSFGNKSVAKNIKILRELSPIEINRAKFDDGYSYGCGTRWGHGYGDGYANCFMDGNGRGCCFIDSDGSCYGNGYGYGYGTCFGNGCGEGYDRRARTSEILLYTEEENI